MTAMNAATVVKGARRQSGLTQAQLAERMGTTQSVVARLESRDSNPRLATLRRAIEATGQELELVTRSRASTVDESMISANLRVPTSERLARFAQAYASVASLVSHARRG